MQSPSFRDLEVLSRTVFGEARGEGMEGKTAVAATVINRWKSGRWFGADTIAGTCLKKWQYSCWLLDDPNRAKLLNASLDDRIFRDCVEAALRALAGSDPTHGCCHYYRRGTRMPEWAEGREPYREIGAHLFFKGVP